jgi:hypothetical protein
MKKTIFLAILMAFSLSASTVFAANSDPKNSTEVKAVPVNTENTLTKEESARLTKRVEEIRDMDKSNLTVSEKSELRKELKETKEAVKRDGGYIYIGTGTLILVVILLIILL